MGKRTRWLLALGVLAVIAAAGPASRVEAAACTG